MDAFETHCALKVESFCGVCEPGRRCADCWWSTRRVIIWFVDCAFHLHMYISGVVVCGDSDISRGQILTSHYQSLDGAILARMMKYLSARKWLRWKWCVQGTYAPQPPHEPPRSPGFTITPCWASASNTSNDVKPLPTLIAVTCREPTQQGKW